MRHLAIIIVLALFAAGCAGEEPTYQGKPASEWIALSRDTDGKTRGSTIDALITLGGHEPARRRLAQMAEEDRDMAVRIEAASRGSRDRAIIVAAYRAALEGDWNHDIALKGMLAFTYIRELPEEFAPDVCDLLESRMVDDLAAEVLSTWLLMYRDEDAIIDTIHRCAEPHIERDDRVGRTLRAAIRGEPLW